MKTSMVKYLMAERLGLNLYRRGHTYDGYTLFAPQAGTNVFLIDMRGDVGHRWKRPEHLDAEVDDICFLGSRNECTHTNACEVLPNGNILTSFCRLNTIAIIATNRERNVCHAGTLQNF